MLRRLLALTTSLALLAPSPALTQSSPAASLDKGIRLTREGDYEGAVTTLQGVIKQLGSAPGSAKDLGRAYTYLGVAHQGLGQDAAAKADFQAALKADPTLVLSASEFPPKVIQAFAAARSAAGLPAATGPAIDHSPLKCLEQDLFPEVRAAIQSPASVQKSRVYFKAHQYPDWYYVEMASALVPSYLGMLPRPLPGTEKVDYYVYALDNQLQTAQTAEYDPDVSKTCKRDKAAAAPSKPAEPKITLFGTKEGQAPIPPGFDKAGIVAFVTVAGAMIAGAALAGGTAGAAAGGAAAGGATAGAGGGSTGAASAGAAGAAAGGGMSIATIGLIAGGVAAAGIGVAVAAGGKEDPLATDNDGDGVSENAGDCNDANPNVRPGGSVDFAVDFAFTGSVDCGAKNGRAQTYRVTNNSCNAVTVNGLSVASRKISGNCTVISRTTQLPLQTSSVGPGASTLIRTGAAAGSSFLGLCCFGDGCLTGSCVEQFDYTLTTSAGTFAQSNNYTITFPNPNSCPPGSQCPRNIQVPPYAFTLGSFGGRPMPVCGSRDYE